MEMFDTIASPAEELLRERRLRCKGHCLRVRGDGFGYLTAGGRGADCCVTIWAAVASIEEMCWHLLRIVSLAQGVVTLWHMSQPGPWPGLPVYKDRPCW